MTVKRRASTGGKETVLTVDGIEVHLVRKSVRNINLRVRPDGSLWVSASPRTSLASIERFVASKRAWIERAQERLQTNREKVQASCVEGAVVSLWGQELTVRITPHMAQGRWPRCCFVPRDDQLEVAVDARIADDSASSLEARNRQLYDWLAEQLRGRIGQLLDPYQKLMGVSASAVRLRTMSSRWGSCNTRTKVITLATQLVHHHPDCLAYVLVHELCHLIEPSHNARFHALMDQYYPTWRHVRAKLNGR